MGNGLKLRLLAPSHGAHGDPHAALGGQGGVESHAILATRGLHLSIEFTGGTVLEVRYEQSANIDKVRHTVRVPVLLLRAPRHEAD